VDEYKKIILQSLEIRAFEETLLDNYGNLNVRGTAHTSLGQELTSVVLSNFIQEGDYVFGTHRSHGIYLSITRDFKGLFSEILGVSGATSGGIGGSQHLHSGNLFTNGVQGGLMPISAGVAHVLKDKSEYISVCIIGDGTFGTGVLYESLNLISLYQLPVLMVIEDNEIAQSTRTASVLSSSIVERLRAFDVNVIETSTDDLNDLHEAISSAFTKVRSQRAPLSLIVKSRRLGPHSKGDDNRPKSEILNHKKNDLLEKYLLDLEYGEIFEKKKNAFNSLILELAEAEKVKNYARNFAEECENLSISIPSELQNKDIRQLTYEAIRKVLECSNDSIIMGEDIEFLPSGMERGYGGAFGVTKDLSIRYPGQVLNTPISEAGIVGFGIGRALAGKKTIVEIMFGDFSTLIVDQILQQASKLVSMYGKRVNIPILVRLPMGGRRGYGPTHSQNLEGIFFGVPNLIVYSQNIYFEPIHYSELLNSGLPTIVIEHKDLYGSRPKEVELRSCKTIFYKNGLIHLEPAIKQEEILVITYGYASVLVSNVLEKIFYRYEKTFDVLILTIVSPINLTEFLPKLKRFKKVLVVEESDAAKGISGLLTKELTRLSVDTYVRVCGGDGIIGASAASEGKALLDESKIQRLIMDLL
jgi:2-oxoisovalerate dehydrogenase E1 component